MGLAPSAGLQLLYPCCCSLMQPLQDTQHRNRQSSRLLLGPSPRNRVSTGTLSAQACSTGKCGCAGLSMACHGCMWYGHTNTLVGADSKRGRQSAQYPICHRAVLCLWHGSVQSRLPGNQHSSATACLPCSGPNCSPSPPHSDSPTHHTRFKAKAPLASSLMAARSQCRTPNKPAAGVHFTVHLRVKLATVSLKPCTRKPMAFPFILEGVVTELQGMCGHRLLKIACAMADTQSLAILKQGV